MWCQALQAPLVFFLGEGGGGLSFLGYMPLYPENEESLGLNTGANAQDACAKCRTDTLSAHGPGSWYTQVLLLIVNHINLHVAKSGLAEQLLLQNLVSNSIRASGNKEEKQCLI